MHSLWKPREGSEFGRTWCNISSNRKGAASSPLFLSPPFIIFVHVPLFCCCHIDIFFLTPTLAMDLLDYGSSSDEEDADKKKAAAPPAAAVASAPKSILKKPPAAAAAKPPATEKLKKKILSLQAVLPPHILQQLTQSQVQGDNEEDDEDDDEDDWKAPASSSPTAAKQGIHSFLSELQQSAPTKNTSNHKSSSKLGAAFLSTTTVVTQKSDAVRDIHGEAPVEETSVTKPAVQAAPKQLAPPAVVPATSAVDVPATMPPPPQPTAAASSTTTTAAAVPSKRQRQEMERLLRQGQFDAALTNSQNTIAMAQPASLQPTDGASQAVDTTGLIRHTATPLYQASQGQAVVGHGGAGRGKNQIHHLLANAASLDLARARGLVGKNTGKKNTGKRKYGW